MESFSLQEDSVILNGLSKGISMDRPCFRWSMFLAFGLFVTSLSSAQDLLSIYQDHLPPSMRNAEGLAFAKPNITSLAEIDPSLVYYFIVSMEVRSREGDSPQFYETQQAVAALRTAARQRRKVWAERQHASISNTSHDPTVREKARSIFVQLAEAEVRVAKDLSFPVSVDANRKDYFTLLFHLRDGSAAYDAQIDYTARLRSVEDSLRTLHLGAIGSANGEMEVRSASDRLLSDWYLFDGPSAVGMSGAEPYQVVLEALSRSYSLVVEDFDPWRVSIGWMMNTAHEAEHVYVSNPVLDPGSATVDVTRRQIMLSIGYRFQIKPVRTQFSHVSVQLVYLTGQGSTSMVPHIEKLEMRTESAPPPYVSVEYRNAILSSGGSMKVGGLRVYALEVSTPLAYLTPSVSLEGSIIAGVSQATYDISYAYNYTQLQRLVYPSGSGVVSTPHNGQIVEDRAAVTDNALLVRPALQIVIHPLRHLLVTASVTYGLAGVSVAALF
jgi:hypothetical protein